MSWNPLLRRNDKYAIDTAESIFFKIGGHFAQCKQERGAAESYMLAQNARSVYEHYFQLNIMSRRPAKHAAIVVAAMKCWLRYRHHVYEFYHEPLRSGRRLWRRRWSCLLTAFVLDTYQCDILPTAHWRHLTTPKREKATAWHEASCIALAHAQQYHDATCLRSLNQLFIMTPKISMRLNDFYDRRPREREINYHHALSAEQFLGERHADGDHQRQCGGVCEVVRAYLTCLIDAIIGTHAGALSEASWIGILMYRCKY